MLLPKEFSSKRGEFETKIINISNKIFKNKILGICFCLLINAIYLYFCYYKNPFIATFIFFYLLFLISHIIFYQFKGQM